MATIRLITIFAVAMVVLTLANGYKESINAPMGNISEALNVDT